MTAARIMFTALATVALTAGMAAASFACDKDKAATTSAKRMKPMAITASSEAGTCGFKATTTAATVTASSEAADHCAAKKATAVTASAKSADHCAAKKATAVTASAKSADHCAAKKATAVTASAKSAGACAVKTTAVAASAGGKDCCAMKGTSAKAAKAKAKKNAMMVSASNQGASCGGTGMAGIAASVLHDDCEACLDMTNCSEMLDAANAQRQIVRLKNGLMLVYTGDTPARIGAIQAAVASRGEQQVRFASAGDKVRLCGECKSLRGAIAGGKLHREVSKMENGSFMLLTSNDAAVVARLHGMADIQVAAR